MSMNLKKGNVVTIVWPKRDVIFNYRYPLKRNNHFQKETKSMTLSKMRTLLSSKIRKNCSAAAHKVNTGVKESNHNMKKLEITSKTAKT